MSYLKTIAMGNLGSNAQAREYGENTLLLFSIAHNLRKVTKDGEVKERAIWLNCRYWVKTGSGLPFCLTKGTAVLVEGIPEADAYEDKAGKPAASLKLDVKRLELIGTPKKADHEPPPSNSPAPASH